MQETLLRALRDLAQYDPGRAANNIFPWLTGLARNEIHRALGREKPLVSLETLWDNMDRELLAATATAVRHAGTRMLRRYSPGSRQAGLTDLLTNLHYNDTAVAETLWLCSR